LAGVTGAGIEFDIVDLAVKLPPATDVVNPNRPTVMAYWTGAKSSVVEPVSCTVPVELVFESQAGAVGRDVAALQRVGGAIAGAQVRLAFLAGRSHPSLAASCRTARALCTPAISFPLSSSRIPRQSRQPRACTGPVTQSSAPDPGVRAAKDWSRL
jgi:hypothetical protein